MYTRILLPFIISIMKTIKKAIIGMLFLMPLLLPSETKAGPGPDFHSIYDRPMHQTFGHHDLISPSRRYLPGQRGAFRPFDPWADRHNYGSPTSGGDPVAAGPGGGGNAVPIDGGIVFLLIAGLGLGMLKVYERKRRLDAAVMRN
jgi:hypothetical protein